MEVMLKNFQNKNILGSLYHLVGLYHPENHPGNYKNSLKNVSR